MSQTLRVTEKELAKELLNVELREGMPMFASVEQITKAKLNVKSRVDKTIKNPYTEVLKLSKVGIILNSEYVKAVTNQLKREGKETTEYKKGVNTMPLDYGENNRFIGLYTENMSYVLVYRPNPNIKPDVTYIADGKRVNKAELVDFLPPVKNATNQGTDKEIFWRKVYLSNLVKLTLNGITYELIR